MKVRDAHVSHRLDRRALSILAHVDATKILVRIQRAAPCIFRTPAVDQLNYKIVIAVVGKLDDQTRFESRQSGTPVDGGRDRVQRTTGNESERDYTRYPHGL